MTIVRTLGADPLLAVLTAVLTACVWAPIFVTPFLPLQDLPDHTAGAALLWDTIFGDGLPAYHYRVQAVPVPYWTPYVLLATASAAVGPLLAAKVVVAFAVLLVPLGVMRLLVALRRGPQLGLWAFALAWDHNLYWGWLATVLGLGFLLFALAHIVEAETPRRALRAWPWVVLVALTHALAMGTLLVLGLALAAAQRPIRRRLAVHATALAAGFVALLPWVISRLAAGGPVRTSAPLGFEWHSLSHKAAHLFDYTLNEVPGRFGEGAMAIAFFVLLLGPLALRALPQEERTAEDRGAGILFAAAATLYLALPMAMSGPIDPWYVYPRQATVLLACALFVPRPRLAGWRALVLAPGVIAAVLAAVAVSRQFASFGERARPFLKILDAVEPNRAVLTLTLDDGDPALRHGVYNQFHAYIAAVKRGYDPYLFDTQHLPLVIREERARPQPPWNAMHVFRQNLHAPHYDYVLVQGLAHDPVREKEPLPGGGRIRRVLEAGRWRLYAVDRPGISRPSPARSAGR